MRLARRRLTSLVALGLMSAALATGFVACKQQEGEFCQVKSDCASGLLCNASTSTCLPEIIDTSDAAVDAAVDASTVDAPVDASVPVDMATDAPPDA